MTRPDPVPCPGVLDILAAQNRRSRDNRVRTFIDKADKAMRNEAYEDAEQHLNDALETLCRLPDGWEET